MCGMVRKSNFLFAFFFAVYKIRYDEFVARMGLTSDIREISVE
jgi:hypothetical protein